jgi:Spy/CpxP family protein refolding chaperone
MTMRPRFKGALLLTLAFVLGTLVGGLGLAAFQSRSPRPVPGSDPIGPGMMLRRLDLELDLTPEQRTQIESILRETGREFAAMREGLDPRLREVRTRTLGRIREVLTPPQQDKFDALLALRERLRPRRPDIPGPPRSP